VGFPPGRGPRDDEDFKARLRPNSARSLAEAKADDLLVPQVVYGYFACQRRRQRPGRVERRDARRRARFTYPRQRAEPHLCIADFFRPVESGELQPRLRVRSTS
jgi:5-methyltetrahydrofolate--homocysteine methyltransferase